MHKWSSYICNQTICPSSVSVYFAQRSVFVQKALKNHEMTYFPRRILKNVKEMVQSELLGSRNIRQPLFLNIIFPLFAMRNESFSTFEQVPKKELIAKSLKNAIILMSSQTNYLLVIKHWHFAFQVQEANFRNPDRKHITLSEIEGKQLFLTFHKNFFRK